MTWCPPRSTLFPYTTLFRSVTVDDASMKKYLEDHKAEYEKVRARHILIRMTGSPVPVRPGQKDLSEADALAKVQEVRAKDRKSTRLNSSHTVISYAVFCLKK